MGIKKKEQDNSANYSYIPTLVKCKEFEEDGFCGYSDSYPVERISGLLQNCSSLVSSFQAVVPDELDRLGDNSESVITSEKDEDRPWSWGVGAVLSEVPLCPEIYLPLPSSQPARTTPA